MDAEELNMILSDHNLWLADKTKGKRANLSHADLRGADLSGADLSYADFSYADLRSTKMQEIKLQGADLSSSNLRYADLSHADLKCSNLQLADFRYSTLQGADLSDADLQGSWLLGSDMFFAKLTRANLFGEPVKVTPLFIHGLEWDVIITEWHMKIGCRTFFHDTWAEMDDVEINALAESALEFWTVWRNHLISMCKTQRELAEKSIDRS